MSITNLADVASSALRSSFVEAADVVLEEGKSALMGLAAASIVPLLAKSSASFLAAFALACLKAFTDSDESQRIIRKRLELICSEPLLTGLEQLRTADASLVVSQEQEHFRRTTYRAALENFQRAHSFAAPTDKPYIWVLRAATALRIEGGEPEAELMLIQFYEYAEKARTEMLASVPGLKRQEEDLTAEANRLKPDGKGAGLFMGSGLALTDLALDWHERGDLFRRATACRAKWKEAEEKAEEWLAAAECARSLTQVLAKTREVLEAGGPAPNTRPQPDGTAGAAPHG